MHTRGIKKKLKNKLSNRQQTGHQYPTALAKYVLGILIIKLAEVYIILYLII
jgi:hypothetical protein